METNTQNLKNLSQHTINELIDDLVFLFINYGNVPIVYWDQNHGVIFKHFEENTLQYDEVQQVLLFGGFRVNGDQFYDFDKNKYLKNIAQHYLNDLINILKCLLEKNGNIPIVYWDQELIVKFDDRMTTTSSLCGKALYQYDNDQQVLLFGGFHTNGDEFYDFPL